MDEIKNRLNCIESGSISESGLSNFSESELNLEQIKPALMADTDFVSGIVDNIMTNSNLSEIIEQIDIVQTENRELRELLHAQQKTINEMNLMLLKLFSQSLNQPAASVAPALAPEPVTAPALAPEPVTAPALAPEPVTAPALALVPDEPEIQPDVDAAVIQDEPNNENNIQLDVVESSNMQTVD